MGTDIHIAVEKRIAGQWRNVRGDWPDDRCYDAFAILADVRNCRGFAGVKTGSGFVPIALPRGLPDDVDPASFEFLSGEHSSSWITLAELLTYDWTQTAQKQGWVDAREWVRWSHWDRRCGEGPSRYCSGVGGGAVVKITAAEMDVRNYDEDNAPPDVYALAEWTTYYYAAAGWLWAEMVPKLLKLAEGIEQAADVRLVFDFDS